MQWQPQQLQARMKGSRPPYQSLKLSWDEQFLKLFSVTAGFGRSGPREKEVQAEFKNQLLEKYGARNMDPRRNTLWCCVRDEYVDYELIKAAHIFPYKHGQDAMDAIFTRPNPEEPEPVSPLNGLLIHGGIKVLLDRGNMVIVPNVPDLASKAQVQAW